MARIVKTDYKGYGRPHREHRSKKNRKRLRWGEKDLRNQRKKKLEELKLKDSDENFDNRA